MRYGKAHNYIVAAVGDSSVEHCLELRLPCYNASEVVPKARASEGDAGRNTQEWFNMVRAAPGGPRPCRVALGQQRPGTAG